MADASPSSNPVRPVDPPDKAKGIAGCIGRGLSHAGNYPCILGVALFVLVIYRCFPCVFSLLASSFPVIICTAIFLGILLGYGNPDVPNNGNREIEVPIEKGKEAKGNKAKEPKELKVETDAGSDGCFDSSLGSPWQPIDRQCLSSDSDSDSSESSSPDASMMTTDIVSMTDELHPLLDNESPQMAFKSGDNWDATSDGSSRGSDDEEELHEDEDDDDNTHEEKDDGNEEAVKWTADDQKNLMDLGTSEIERNRRLENLIARRSMRRSIVSELEGFLINLDVTYPAPAPAPSIDEPSQIQAQDPPISAATRRSLGELSQIQFPDPPISAATRRNPFDVPCASEEMSGLAIIPGSGPSMIHPKLNPFDLPCDQADQSSNTAVAGLSNQVFVPVPPQDPFFRRHESFTLGASLPGEFGHEMRDGELKPYFIPERVETGLPSLQRQLCENNNSNSNTPPESDTTSSMIDQGDQKDLLEEGVHPDGESPSPADHDAGLVGEESESSDETDSVDVNHEQSQPDIDAAQEISLNASMVAEGTHEVTEALAEEYNLSISGDDKLEVIEDKHDETNSSSSSDWGENSSKHEIPANLEPVRDEPLKFTGDSTHSLPVDTGILSRVGEIADEVQVGDPVYDSSPSAAENPLNGGSFHTGKTSSNLTSSLSSDTEDSLSETGSSSKPAGNMEDNLSEAGYSSKPTENREDNFSGTGSSSKPTENTALSEGDPERLAFPSGGLWVASPNLSSIDEIESQSREINEIKELDVIQVGVPGVHEDDAKPIKLVMQRLPTSKLMYPSAFSPTEAESIKDAD